MGTLGAENQEEAAMVRIRLRWLGALALTGGVAAVSWLCWPQHGDATVAGETLEERLQRESNVIPTCEPEDGVAPVPYRVSDATAVALPPEIDVHNPPRFSRVLFMAGTGAAEAKRPVAAPSQRDALLQMAVDRIRQMRAEGKR